MKSSFIAILFLLLMPLAGVPAKELGAGRPKSNLPCQVAPWQPHSIVSVYFVRDMFGPDQRQALLDAMGSAQENARDMGLAFNYAGETDGLIDCQGCLTVTRQDADKENRKARITLNALRRNDLGQLISAWIGIDRETNSSMRLRRLMLETLVDVRGARALSACKR
jgi:hypothetical protein